MEFIRYDASLIPSPTILSNEGRRYPDESFLAFRLLARYNKSFFHEKIELALEETTHLILTSPDTVE